MFPASLSITHILRPTEKTLNLSAWLINYSNQGQSMVTPEQKQTAQIKANHPTKFVSYRKKKSIKSISIHINKSTAINISKPTTFSIKKKQANTHKLDNLKRKKECTMKPSRRAVAIATKGNTHKSMVMLQSNLSITRIRLFQLRHSTILKSHQPLTLKSHQLPISLPRHQNLMNQKSQHHLIHLLHRLANLHLLRFLFSYLKATVHL